MAGLKFLFPRTPGLLRYIDQNHIFSANFGHSRIILLRCFLAGTRPIHSEAQLLIGMVRSVKIVHISNRYLDFQGQPGGTASRK